MSSSSGLSSTFLLESLQCVYKKSIGRYLTLYPNLQSDLYRALQRENDTLAKELDECKGQMGEQMGQIEQLKASLDEAKRTIAEFRKVHLGFLYCGE
jgi:chaperonin cofactor prefoldin